MPDKTTYRFKNDLSELPDLCQKIEQFGRSLGLQKKSLFEIHLAVEEHFTNIVTHGFTDKNAHWITMHLSCTEEMVEVCLEDDGVAFNPVEASAPDTECRLEDRQLGGLGVHLAKRCVDRMDYRREGPKNILTLRKRI